MSLQETEVLDRLKSSMRQAIEDCKALAVKSVEGSPYQSLRDNLALIEGCCRQMAVFRDDTRWLPFGIAMANIHQRAGNWLRGYSKTVGLHTVFIIWRPGVLNEAFIKLGGELAVILDHLETMATAKTGQRGPVLPSTPAEERRFGRPALDNRSKKPQSLILPPKFKKSG